MNCVLTNLSLKFRERKAKRNLDTTTRAAIIQRGSLRSARVETEGQSLTISWDTEAIICGKIKNKTQKFILYSSLSFHVKQGRKNIFFCICRVSCFGYFFFLLSSKDVLLFLSCTLMLTLKIRAP